jgi:hypothetical protein
VWNSGQPRSGETSGMGFYLPKVFLSPRQSRSLRLILTIPEFECDALHPTVMIARQHPQNLAALANSAKGDLSLWQPYREAGDDDERLPLSSDVKYLGGGFGR